jgi:hypothetical protein
MKLHELVKSTKSRDDLAKFVAALRTDFQQNPGEWENPTLDRFLSAMESWIEDMDGYFLNKGLEMPEAPSWQLVAHILYASKIYE